MKIVIVGSLVLGLLLASYASNASASVAGILVASGTITTVPNPDNCSNVGDPVNVRGQGVDATEWVFVVDNPVNENCGPPGSLLPTMAFPVYGPWSPEGGCVFLKAGPITAGGVCLTNPVRDGFSVTYDYTICRIHEGGCFPGATGVVSGLLITA